MKAVGCPSCGARMKRNGRPKAGTQRWRCPSCGASTTLSYDDAAARLGEFLAWLTSKETHDLFQDFGHASERGHAASGIPPGFGAVRSKNASILPAGVWYPIVEWGRRRL